MFCLDDIQNVFILMLYISVDVHSSYVGKALSSKRRLTWHLGSVRWHLRRLTLDVKSCTFFAPNGHT